MPDDTDFKCAFLNRRDWGSYMRALQNATCPNLLDAVRSSRDLFAQGASHASNWLVGSSEELRDKLSTG